MFRSNKSKFYSWISKSLSREIPPETIGIHFNFYEAEGSVHIQLFGMSSYKSEKHPVRDYWPGEETFSTEEDVFDYPLGELGGSWEYWLESLLALLKEYIELGKMSPLLRQYQAVGAGFVDGDMYLIWQGKP